MTVTPYYYDLTFDNKGTSNIWKIIELASFYSVSWREFIQRIGFLLPTSFHYSQKEFVLQHDIHLTRWFFIHGHYRMTQTSTCHRHPADSSST